MQRTIRINLGCGMTPTPGWTNLENSLTVRIARSALAPLASVLLDPGQKNFFAFARNADIHVANALKLPFIDGSVDVIYSSHMLEHLDQHEAKVFLNEAKRVLKPRGVLRIGVPDIRILVDEYLETGDADRFIFRTSMVEPKPRGLLRKLKYALLTGFRRHNWMYDGPSLAKLLRANGFEDPIVQPAGKTRIQDPGELDLAERASSTVFIEALRP